MVYYCSLVEAKRHLKANKSMDDDTLLDIIGEVSRRFDVELGGRASRPYFAPYSEARQFVMDTMRISSHWNTFEVDQPLLSVSAVTVGTNTVTSDVSLFPADRTPVDRLYLNRSAGSWYDYANSSEVTYVTVTGVWGYHSQYDEAWVSYSALDANIADASTLTTVAQTDAEDRDPFGRRPQYSIGQLIRINSEVMQIEDITVSGFILRRGLLGTSTAAHTAGDTIEVWQVEDPIRRLAAQQAAAWYARMGGTQPREAGDLPTDLEHEVARTLRGYQYV